MGGGNGAHITMELGVTTTEDVTRSSAPGAAEINSSGATQSVSLPSAVPSTPTSSVEAATRVDQHRASPATADAPSSAALPSRPPAVSRGLSAVPAPPLPLRNDSPSAVTLAGPADQPAAPAVGSKVGHAVLSVPGPIKSAASSLDDRSSRRHKRPDGA
jgi:hypothetical protein